MTLGTTVRDTLHTRDVIPGKDLPAGAFDSDLRHLDPFEMARGVRGRFFKFGGRWFDLDDFAPLGDPKGDALDGWHAGLLTSPTTAIVVHYTDHSRRRVRVGQATLAPVAA